MNTKEAIQEFLEFDPKLFGDTADKIVKAIKVFQDSESDVSVQLRKAACAKQISESLMKLSAEAGRVMTNIQCEIAVIQAQKIINQ